MDWTQLDWQALNRLRENFLRGGDGAAAGEPYWRSRADLANYDLTYAERIGWKWDAVLSELRHRGWAPPARARVLLDWGCGSGVASRRVLRAFGAENFDTLLLWDCSLLARDYATEVARRDFPKLSVAEFAGAPPASFVLVVSHVINELAPEALAELLALARRAEAVIWVEPGTHADSRALVAVREQFRERENFRIVAPCTHEGACGLLAAGNERHWCHNFAEPPPNIYADSNWVKFGRRAGIDLRSLPYSFLALEKKRGDVALAVREGADVCRRVSTGIDGGVAAPASADNPKSEIRNPQSSVSRVIGRPRFHKAHAAICNCDINGVSELTLHKRSAPAFFKKLERVPAHPPLYVWGRDAAAPERIVSAAGAPVSL